MKSFISFCVMLLLGTAMFAVIIKMIWFPCGDVLASCVETEVKIMLTLFIAALVSGFVSMLFIITEKNDKPEQGTK